MRWLMHLLQRFGGLKHRETQSTIFLPVSVRSFTLSFTLLLLVAVLSCKKTPGDAVSPTVVTPDPRPVEGDYRFYFTDPKLAVGIYRRYPTAKLDVFAAGSKSPEGYLTSITSAFFANPNTKDWVWVAYDKGYPHLLFTSKGYSLSFKNYDSSAKSVDITIELDGKVVKEVKKATLDGAFFTSIDQYRTLLRRGGRLADNPTPCQQAKDLNSALGAIANATGCVAGVAGIAMGGITLVGAGVSVFASCFGVADYLVEQVRGEGHGLISDVFGPEVTSQVKLSLDILGSVPSTPAGAVSMLENFLKVVGYIGVGSDLAEGTANLLPSPCDQSALSSGDPHLTTFDGLYYDFQGHGEFVAVKSTTDNFEVQVRQEDPGDSGGQATINTAVAVQTGTDVVCVVTKPDRLYINNQLQNLATFTRRALKDGASVSKSNEDNRNVVAIRHKNSGLVKVRLSSADWLDYSLYLPEARKGKVEGMLGNYDDNRDNDVQVRGGEVLSQQGLLRFEDMYPGFADSWRTSQTNSLFYYDAGKTTNSFTQRNFPRTPINLTADQRTRAESTCRAAGVTEEPYLSNCILDVAITGNASLASAALWGQQADSRAPALPLAVVAEAVSIKRITSFESATYLLKSDGSLWVAGWNNRGSFGIGTNQPETTKGFVQIMTGIKDIASASVYSAHMLLLKNDNSVWAAGANEDGQIGNGATDGRDVLTAVKIMDDGLALAVGGGSSFVIKTDHTLWAFGDNREGKLGDGTQSNRSRPVKVMDNVKAVAIGGRQTLILKTDNTVWGTGNGQVGGIERQAASAVLTPIKLLDGVKSIATGDEHSFALKTDHTLWATGNGAAGQLGHGADGPGAERPNFTKVADNVQAIVAGPSRSFLLKTDNTLWATGLNDAGQFGDGTTTSRNTFGQVATNVKMVSTGGNGFGTGIKGSTFLVKTDHTLWATGGNVAGQLGFAVPTQINGFTPVVIK